MCCKLGNIDLSFDPGTQAVIKKFQDKWGITVDGIVGNEIWNSELMDILSKSCEVIAVPPLLAVSLSDSHALVLVHR